MIADKIEPRDLPLARKMYEIIFGADTFSGKTFDLALLVAIVVSVIAVSLETVRPFGQDHADELNAIEWTCTALFTLEYVIRIWCVRRASTYIFSFFGIVDLLSFLPAYIGLAFGLSGSFAVIRALRLLRVFRILQLSWVESEANSLRAAVWDARAKVVVFFVTVLIVVTIAGAAMYEIEYQQPVKDLPRQEKTLQQGDALTVSAAMDGTEFQGSDNETLQQGETSQQDDAPQTADNAQHFESIPQSVYWAIITMTTVGYGDVVPQTTLGKFVAAILVLLGYSLIIVPTGFVSAELGGSRRATSHVTCPHCDKPQHDADAKYCDRCGGFLASG